MARADGAGKVCAWYCYAITVGVNKSVLNQCLCRYVEAFQQEGVTGAVLLQIGEAEVHCCLLLSAFLKG